MNTKQTITVIGVIRNEIFSLCENLLKGNYRLLLCGDDEETLMALAAELKSDSASIEVDVRHCMIEASWEADIIIVSVAPESVRQIAEAIREVANQKIIIIPHSPGTHYEGPRRTLATLPNNDIQQLLPNSKLVQLFFSVTETDPSGHPASNRTIACIASNDEAVLTAVADLLEEWGFNEVITSDPLGKAPKQDAPQLPITPLLIT